MDAVEENYDGSIFIGDINTDEDKSLTFLVQQLLDQ